jgi:hypothetical protein
MNKMQRKRPWRLGRNDSCFCGSGEKYKKCCLPKGLAPLRPSDGDLDGATRSHMLAEYMKHRVKADAAKKALQEKGIYINLPNTIGFKGKKVLGIGNQVILDGNENTTFHELILRELKRTLSREWWESEMQKQPQDRHFVRKCYDALEAGTAGERADLQQQDDNLWSFVPNGYLQTLLSLAFDVYVLQHKNSIPEDWVRRLKQREQYQGVRYEIAVASIFARIGCRLEFYEDNRGTAKHPEFTAHDPSTGDKVAVEAKSRHRNGVIHQQGTFDLTKAMKGDMTGLFNSALQKETDNLPYMIFMDVNAPRDIGSKTEETRWFQDIQKMMDKYHMPTAEEPDIYNLICLTNYSHHYEEDKVVQPGQNCSIRPLHVEHPLAGGINGPFIQKVLIAVNGYGFVPNL